MEWPEFKLNGMLRLLHLSSNQKRLGKMLSLTCLAILLSGCATTNITGTTTNRQSKCAAWRAITYSASKDTKMTVDQIRTHNAVGKKLGCWR